MQSSITIESFQNPRIKRVVRLRDAGERRTAGRFLIDGEREIALAIDQGIELETIFVDPHATGQPRWQRAASASVEPLLQPVSPKVLSRISYGQRQATPVAIAVTPQLALERLQWSPPSLILVLDQTEKPGNVGACLRSASACGVAAVVLTDPVCELFNPNTIRASRGTIFSLFMAVASRDEFLNFCRQQNVPRYTARVDAGSDLWQQDFTRGGAVIFGSEAQGLGPQWEEAGTQPFTIPMQGVTDSLNLSISAAVTLYEARRQQRR